MPQIFEQSLFLLLYWKCFLKESINCPLIDIQGYCDPSSDEFYPTIKDCQYSCSAGECPGKLGNEQCQDEKWSCPHWKYEVAKKFIVYKKGSIYFLPTYFRVAVIQVMKSF